MNTSAIIYLAPALMWLYLRVGLAFSASFEDSSASFHSIADSLRALFLADSLAAHYYAPILWFDADEKYYPTIPFFTAFQWKEKGNGIRGADNIIENPELIWPAGSWDDLVKIYDETLKAHRAQPESKPAPRVWVFWDKTEIAAGRFKDLVNLDRQFKNRDQLYIDSLETLRKQKTMLRVFRYWFYYINDWGLQGHPQDIETIFVFAPKAKTETAPLPLPLAVVGAGHSDMIPNNVLLLPQSERIDSLYLHVLVERGGHASAPDRNGDGLFSPGFDANWQAVKLWGTRDTQAASGLGTFGNYRSWMTFPRHEEDRCMPPRLQKEVMVRLTYLPRGLSASDFKNKTRFEIHERSLIFRGVMSAEEKQELLALSSDYAYHEAIEQLFEKSQRGVWSYTLLALKDLQAVYDSIEVLPVRLASASDSTRWLNLGRRLEKLEGPPAEVWLAITDAARSRAKNWLKDQWTYNPKNATRKTIKSRQHMPWQHFYYTSSPQVAFKEHLFPPPGLFKNFFRGIYARFVSKREFIAGAELFVIEDIPLWPNKIIRLPGVLIVDTGFHFITASSDTEPLGLSIKQNSNQISGRLLYDTGYATLLSGYFGWGSQTNIKKDESGKYNTTYFLYSGMKAEYYLRALPWVFDFIQLRAGVRVPVKGLQLNLEEETRIELQLGLHR